MVCVRVGTTAVATGIILAQTCCFSLVYLLARGAISHQTSPEGDLISLFAPGINSGDY